MISSKAKTQIILILGVLLLISIFASIGFVAANYESKRKLRIEQDNVFSLMQKAKDDSSGHAYALKLTRQQMEDYYASYIDSLNKTHQAEKIKLKHVNSITQVKLDRAYAQIQILLKDTNIYLPGKTDTLWKAKKGRFQNDCLSFDILYPEGKDYFLATGKLNIGIDLINYQGDRSKQVRIGKLKLFRYGRRLSEWQAFSTCDSTKLSVSHVEVIRQ